MNITEKRGMFAAKVFNSRIKSANVQKSERWLGYFLGPAGVMMMYFTISGTYLNVFYTDVLKISYLWGGLFLTVMPIVSKFFDAFSNIIMGRIIDSTRSRQGKARPWLLMSAPALAISGILLFIVPQASVTVQMWWIIISYNLFFGIACAMYSMSNMLMIPLSTRNTKQRDGLALMSNVGGNMLPGILISFLFPMLVLPWMGVSHGRWITVMSVLSLIAIPAALMQYYHTKERITEETMNLEVQTNETSLMQQLRGCLSSKYWIIFMIIYIIFQVYNVVQNTSLLYYCNWVLGTYNDGKTQAIVSAIGQAPLGIGIFLMWPLCKKFGKRNIMMVGFVLAVVGSAICLAAPTSMGVVLIGLMIKSIGTLPTYVVMAMMAEALDHVEWKNGYRCDGLSASVISIIGTVSSGIGMGLFNRGLSLFGYVAPAADGSWVAQNSNVQNFFTFGYNGIPLISFVIIIVLLIFFKVEKEIPRIHSDITARHKADAEAQGLVWVSPEEKALKEQQELDLVAEEKRTEELKEKCRKKGLSFEEEEAKHQEKLAAKAAKGAKKNEGNKE